MLEEAEEGESATQSRAVSLVDIIAAWRMTESGASFSTLEKALDLLAESGRVTGMFMFFADFPFESRDDVDALGLGYGLSNR